jgi:hypothetical protein
VEPDYGRTWKYVLRGDQVVDLGESSDDDDAVALARVRLRQNDMSEAELYRVNASGIEERVCTVSSARQMLEQRLSRVVPVEDLAVGDLSGSTPEHEAGHVVCLYSRGRDVDAVVGQMEGHTLPVGGIEEFADTDPRGALLVAVAGGVSERLHGVGEPTGLGMDTANVETAAEALGCADLAKLIDDACSTAEDILRQQLPAIKAIVPVIRAHCARPGSRTEGADLQPVAKRCWTGERPEPLR